MLLSFVSMNVVTCSCAGEQARIVNHREVVCGFFLILTVNLLRMPNLQCYDFTCKSAHKPVSHNINLPADTPWAFSLW